MRTRIILLFISFMSSIVIMAQYKISGTVKDKENLPLPGIYVRIIGSEGGTITDFDGKYTMTVTYGDIVEFTSVGYESHAKVMDGSTTVDIVMTEGNALDEVVVIGSRNPSRTAVDSAVPVDVINISSMKGISAQTSLNEILNYIAPSFTSQTQTVSDGTDHVDPASLRGLGPDEVLVLINGKRRHNSSLINVNGTVGAGSVGTDLNAIPMAAIERIEILRDGAAAQYGSDAIAGIINIVLKKATYKLDLSLTTGANISSKSKHQEGGMDGEKIQIDANYGLDIGENGGFINFTGSVATRNPALRNASNLEQIYDIANAVENAYTTSTGMPISSMTAADYQTGVALLGTEYISAADKITIAGLNLTTDVNGNLNVPNNLVTLRNLLPDGGIGEFASYEDLDDAQFLERGQTREDFRFKVGTSKLREGKFFTNLSLPVSDNAAFYSFGGISYRQGLAYGFLREPWRPKANVASNPNGFLPGIQSDILDKSIAIGIKGESDSGWNIDFSNTSGSNSFAFTVVESTNASLGSSSPETFDAGSFKFSQNTTNLDVYRLFEDTLEGLNVAFGAEYRVDHYQVFEGEEKSYTTYDNNGLPTINGVGGATNALGELLPGASQVYAGFTPQNATDKLRNSIGGYIDVEADIMEELMVNMAARYESYSDFGETFNYKASARFKVTDQINVRGAYSTGFKAPSLHQQYFERSSTIFNAGGAAEEVGLFTSESKLANLLGIEKLKEETSESISFGVTAKMDNFSVTVDAYQITIKDRIGLSGKFDDGGDPELTEIFTEARASKAQFITNAVDTRNRGVDVVARYKIEDIISDFNLDNNLAGTISETEILKINVPTKIVDAGLSLDFFDGQEEAFLTVAQPRTKVSLSHILSNDTWKFMVRNVYFGSVTDPDEFQGNATVVDTTIKGDAVYAAKIVTDLSISNRLSEEISVTVGATNLLDVYPDDNRLASQSNGSFPYSRRTSQFGFMGRYVFVKLKFNL